MKVVKFKYYDEFHCIGPECPETCCQQWDIHFSKKDYLKYKNLKCSPKLKEALNGCLVRNRADDADESSHYAKIKFNEKGYCSLLDEKGLCMIHKELGESALGFVCATFPRLQAEIGNEAYVFSCEITCPHVVEILMNHPEGLEIVEEDYDGSSSFVNKGMFSSPCTSSLWKGYPYYWIIKSAQIDILQNRSFNISERLLILGFFSMKADEYIASGQGEKIESLYNMILNNEFCKSIVDSLKTSQSDESAAQKSIDLFCRQLYAVRHANKSPLISKLFEQTAQSLDVDIREGEQRDQITFNYDMEKYFGNVGVFRGIELDRPYIFENILVNLAFVSPPNYGIFKSFFDLSVFYNTLKIALPALLNKEKGNWTDTDLALAFSKSAKMILNSKIADLVTKADFESNNSFDLPHIAFLIS